MRSQTCATITAGLQLRRAHNARYIASNALLLLAMDADKTVPTDIRDKNNQERRIRTFVGDMETLKKGSVSGTEQFPQLSPIETYSGDFSQRVKETGASTMAILAAEQDSASRTTQAASEEKPSRKRIVYIIAGVVLFAAGIIGAYVTYGSYMTAIVPIVTEPGAFSPIFVDEKKQISGYGSDLLLSIKQSIVSPLTLGNVRLLYFASTTAGSIFPALPISAPSVLLRDMNDSGSMTGIVNINGNQSPFFIISVSSYGNTFSGMLSWEATIPRALGALFPAYPPLSVSTSSPSSQPAVQSGFYDEVVDNHDIRVYRDSAGRSVILYGYWNQTTLVIARDPSAFAEILRRLATSMAQQ